MQHDRRTTSGFTAMEVICVLVVIGILTAAALSKVSTSDAYDVNAEAEIIKSHLRYAQIRAMNTNAIWWISFPSSTSYTIANNIGGSTPAIPGSNSATANLSSGITLTLDGVSSSVCFDTLGIPYTDTNCGSLQAQGDGWRTFTVSKGSASRSIQVRNNTGFIP